MSKIEPEGGAQGAEVVDGRILNGENSKYTLQSLTAQDYDSIAVALETCEESADEIAARLGIGRRLFDLARNRLEDEGRGFNVNRWKKRTAATLAHFSSRGSTRLLREVDSIPLPALCIAVAVAIDKIALLADQPQVVVEHRLRVTSDSINEMMKAATIIDVQDENSSSIKNVKSVST